MTTLGRIRTKVRRLTGSPSPNQLTDVQIDQYVNDFYQYDFPEHLRVTQLNDNYYILTEPGRDLYTIGENYAINNSSPVYIDGQLARFTEDQTEFYSWWPKLQQTLQVSTGTGTASYSFTLADTPILPGSFSTSGQQANDVWGNMVDVGYDGVASGPSGNLRQMNANPGNGGGTVTYATGAVSVTFPVAIATGSPIYASYESYVAGRPTSVLSFQSTDGIGGRTVIPGLRRRQLRVRPVPDKVYQVDIQVWHRPVILESSGDSPILNEWWQLLAIGAAKKVLEDRMDTDGVQNLLPQYQEQMSLCINRTAVQYSSTRTATIYSQMMNNAGAFGWNNGVQ